VLKFIGFEKAMNSKEMRDSTVKHRVRSRIGRDNKRAFRLQSFHSEFQVWTVHRQKFLFSLTQHMNWVRCAK
jgi:hypothetical protein